MDSACLRQTEIPHTSKLFSDFQYHFDRVSHFFAYPPGDPSSFLKAAAEMNYPPERREALVAALRKDNEGSPSLELLAEPGTVAVVTGQQAGLFSGPAYTVYKALTAARLAAELTQRGITAVPVFWLATEDHDLAEVNHCHVFNRGHVPVRLEVDGSVSGTRPVGHIAIENPPIEQLREQLAGFPYGDDITDAVAQAYMDGAAFGTAFEQLLRRLLAQWNFIFVDPLDAGLRRLAAPLLCDALRDSTELKQKLLARNQELKDHGYHAQVLIEQQTSLFFLLEDDRRVSLRRQNGDYTSKDRTYTVSELVDRAEHLSPNALLRPVMQDYLLPTVAYVGGPAELAYMAQAQVLYEDLLHRMPVMVGRSGFTILDSRAAKLLDRYHLRVASLFQPETTVREQMARMVTPEHLVHEFEIVREKVAQSLDKLGAEVVHFDPTLGRALERSRAKMLYQLAKIEGKAEREAMRRDERTGSDASFLIHLVFPDKHLQERYYSILPFLAKHGPGLLQTIYEHVHLDCPDHKVLVV